LNFYNIYFRRKKTPQNQLASLSMDVIETTPGLSTGLHRKLHHYMDNVENNRAIPAS
jgi:hypothetical protein